MHRGYRAVPPRRPPLALPRLGRRRRRVLCVLAQRRRDRRVRRPRGGGRAGERRRARGRLRQRRAVQLQVCQAGRACGEGSRQQHRLEDVKLCTNPCGPRRGRGGVKPLLWMQRGGPPVPQGQRPSRGRQRTACPAAHAPARQTPPARPPPLRSSSASASLQMMAFSRPSQSRSASCDNPGQWIKACRAGEEAGGWREGRAVAAGLTPAACPQSLPPSAHRLCHHKAAPWQRVCPPCLAPPQYLGQRRAAAEVERLEAGALHHHVTQ